MCSLLADPHTFNLYVYLVLYLLPILSASAPSHDGLILSIIFNLHVYVIIGPLFWNTTIIYFFMVAVHHTCSIGRSRKLWVVVSYVS